MCTAICDGRLCGRTLDNEVSYGESVVFLPRNFNIGLKYLDKISSHSAILGYGIIKNSFPLLFDGINENGLFMAGLNFVGNSHYLPFQEGKINLATFELIPYILSKCACVSEAKDLFKSINITNDSFDKSLGYAEMHWIIGDFDGSIVVEATKNGVQIYENYVGVMTNNPAFDFHLTNLANYMSISPKSPINHICPNVDLPIYSRGMGSLGLPGDFSSTSRFIRAAFLKNHTRQELGLDSQINRFFHILNGVSVPKGCVLNQDGLPVYTIYSNCYSLDSFCVYFKEYDSMGFKVFKPDMLDSDKIITI